MIRAILVDDEPLALQLLEHKLTAYENVHIEKTFTNPLVAIEELPNLSFNTAFLDISMPGMDGMDVAAHLLNIDSRIQIVFVSAYRDYAIQAFELNSIDYILKPLTNERLGKTILRLSQALASVPEPEVANPLQITCFSEFVVRYKQEPIKWKTAKVKELFAFFVTYHGEYVQRDLLIDTLWPDTEYAKAKIQLHTAMSHLRKMLESLGYAKVIVFANQSYCLDLPGFQSDASAMQELLRQHVVPTPATISLFEKSISSYVGDYMELDGYDWTHAHTKYMKLQAIRMLQAMIDYYTDARDTENIQFSLERLLSLDTYSEQTLQRLLTSLMQQEKRMEAIKIYHEFKEHVEEELGISPSQPTNELFQTILTRDQ